MNVDCVPSKTLLAAAGARHGAASNPFVGTPTSAAGVDLGALVGQKDELIGQLRQAKYADVADAYGFQVCSGHASFVDEDTLSVDGQPLRARSYLVATGSQPARPDLAGLDDVDWLTSTTAMELTALTALTALPESLVVGGGYVGLEQAQLFAPGGHRRCVLPHDDDAVPGRDPVTGGGCSTTPAVRPSWSPTRAPARSSACMPSPTAPESWCSPPGCSATRCPPPAVLDPQLSATMAAVDPSTSWAPRTGRRATWRRHR